MCEVQNAAASECEQYANLFAMQNSLRANSGRWNVQICTYSLLRLQK